MGYSPERKTAVLKRMLPPNNMALRRLPQEEGISEATLHKWRAEAVARASFCTLRPKVEVATKTTVPLWSVNGVARAAAPVISQIGGKPVCGGTPADFSVVQAILAIKARGLRLSPR